MTKFQQRLRELGFATYEEYLVSEHWYDFKQRYRASRLPIVCAVCASPEIVFHHHTYVRLGREELTDVTPLCRAHHDSVHEWLKTSGYKFVEFTHLAIKYARGEVVSEYRPKIVTLKPALKPWKRRKGKKGKKTQRPCVSCNSPVRRGYDHCRPCARRLRESK